MSMCDRRSHRGRSGRCCFRVIGVPGGRPLEGLAQVHRLLGHRRGHWVPSGSPLRPPLLLWLLSLARMALCLAEGVLDGAQAVLVLLEGGRLERVGAHRRHHF